MHQRRQVEAEEGVRLQHGEPERAVREDAAVEQAGVGEARQQQRVGPDEDADRHAGDRAARGAAPPDQAAEEGGRELRHRREGEEPDRGELGVTGEAVIEVGEQQDGDDGDAPG